MNLEQHEQKLLVQALVFVAIVYGLVWGSDRYIAQFTNVERKANSDLKSELQGFQERLGQIQVEEQLQSQYVSEYNQFQGNGRIVDQQEAEDAEQSEEARRLVLLTRLKDIIDQRGFFEAGYTLSSPENLPADFVGEVTNDGEAADDSSILIRTTRMDIAMPLLHSLDLLMLINDFYDEQVNRFIPVECGMELVNQRIRSSDPQERRLALFEVSQNIMASCGLVWISVFDPELGKEGTEEDENQSA